MSSSLFVKSYSHIDSFQAGDLLWFIVDQTIYDSDIFGFGC